MYDSVQVYSNTADANAALTGPVNVHKVQVESADGLAALSVQLHDALTVTGTAIVSCTTGQVYASNYDRMAQVDFNPPVAFGKGVSANITGTGTYRVYYVRR
jgi:uncharacterized phosphosugar-binding protein